MAMDPHDSTILKSTPPPADKRVSYGPGPLHYGDLRLPAGPGPHPLVVMVHGGRWRAEYDLQHVGAACAALTKRGLATWNVEYRRMGHIDGGFPGTLLDAGLALDYVRELAPRYNLDLSRLLVSGHSSGGHLALWLAGRHRLPKESELWTESPLRVKAAVALAGLTSIEAAWRSDRRWQIEQFMGGSLEDRPARYRDASPLELLPYGASQVLVHGELDDHLPPSIARRYARRASALGDDARAVVIPEAGHFWLVDPSSPAWPVVEDTIVGLVH